jgi:hypothetical protein
MMSIFSTVTREYPGEREYITLAILSWIFTWTQQIIHRLMIKGNCYFCVSKEKIFSNAYILGCWSTKILSCCYNFPITKTTWSKWLWDQSFARNEHPTKISMECVWSEL